jgi:hypothetical protein
VQYVQLLTLCIFNKKEPFMPDRPMQHRIESMAIMEVSRIWTAIGAATEEVKRDYGEDLLVQTEWEGRMDDSRIWVQVKGSGELKLRGRSKVPSPLRVPIGHALRWSRSADLVVVVRWDVKNKRGWYAFPAFQVSRLALMQQQSGYTAVRFSEDMTFTVDAAREIAWHARFRHALHEVAIARMNHAAAEAFSDGQSTQNPSVSEDSVIAIVDLLGKLGIIGDDGIPEAIIQRCRNGYWNCLDDSKFNDSPQMAFMTAVTLTIIVQASERGMNIIYPDLQELLTNALAKTLLHEHSSIESWAND